MPWISDETSHRKHAMELLERGLGPVEVGRLCGVSRQTIHKWQGRYHAAGELGLQQLSRAPKKHALAVSAEMRSRVVRLRRKYKEGPKKLREYLLRQGLQEKVPAASTIGLILREQGLSEQRTRRRRTPMPSGDKVLTEAAQPNDIWTADFKGEFLVGGRNCYPLTLQDRFSRMVLAIRGDTGTHTKSTKASFWRAFRRYGLPWGIRVDNGTPFVSCTSPAGLTKVSAVWVRLGIQLERTRPGKPCDNGRHERLHKSLKHHTAKPPSQSFSAQQTRFDRYRRHYNHERPHEALGMQTPASVYTPSLRPCPETLPEMEHPAAQHILNVWADGGAKLRGFRFHLGTALAGETVGLIESSDDIYTMSYGPIYLGFIDLRGTQGRFHQAP